MSSIAIIIPCYNEGSRLCVSEFNSFLKEYSSWVLIFVNDGSTDNTPSLVNEIKKTAPGRVFTLNFKENRGKSSAVLAGMLFCLQQNDLRFEYIGYLDADLSAGFDEIVRIAGIAIDHKLDYAYGSRIKKLNSTIDRSFFRHITGRLIATVIDSYFMLGIYDTQCGAKLFSVDLVHAVTGNKFHTKWFFDIEIFLRIKQERPAAKGEEIPLLTWKSRRGSKLGLLQAIPVIREIASLMNNYPGKQNKK